MTQPQPPAFGSWSGPRNAHIVLVGEAHGQHEAECNRPFAGESGKELWRMLGEAWPQLAPEEHSRVNRLHRYGLSWVSEREQWLGLARCAMTNVFNLRPPGNKLDEFCTNKAGVKATPAEAFPPLRLGKYLRSEYLPQLFRLFDELAEVRPNLVIALGNTACWALLRATNIGSIRGAITAVETPTRVQGLKVLPIYHPAGMLRQWSWRPIIIADLMKALRESEYPEIRRPSCRILAMAEIDAYEQWTRETLQRNLPLLACDIETGGKLIKCVGFARSNSEAAVFPFIDTTKPGWSYWPDQALEFRAWNCVRQLLESEIPLIFQNGLYDLQYLLKLGFKPKNIAEDTMLLHHAMYPELQKGLGFLGSIYTNHSSWKLMRRYRPDTEKRDE